MSCQGQQGPWPSHPTWATPWYAPEQHLVTSTQRTRCQAIPRYGHGVHAKERYVLS